MNRVAQLADRKKLKIENRGNEHQYNNRVPYYNLIPLFEIIAEAFGVGAKTKKVKEEYEKLVKNFGNELKILLEIKKEELKGIADNRVIKGISRARQGKVKIRPGYDGEYGKIEIFGGENKKNAPRLF